MTDSKWREVALLTVSLLPDATAFLTGFEGGFTQRWLPPSSHGGMAPLD